MDKQLKLVPGFLLILILLGACHSLPKETGTKPLVENSETPTLELQSTITPLPTATETTILTEKAIQFPVVEKISESLSDELDGTILIIESGKSDNRIRKIQQLSLDRNEVAVLIPEGNCIGVIPSQPVIFCGGSEKVFYAKDIYSTKQVGPGIQNNRGWLDGSFVRQEERKGEMVEYLFTNLLSGNDVLFSPAYGDLLWWPRISNSGDIASVQFLNGEYILLLNKLNGNQKQVILPEGYYLTGTVSWSPDNRYLVAGATNYQSEILGLSNVLLIYDLVLDEIEILLELPDEFDILDGVFQNSLCLWTEDSSSLAVALTSKRIELINVLNGDHQTFYYEASSIAWSPDKQFLTIVGQTKDDELSMIVIDTNSRKVMLKYPFGENYLNYYVNWIE